MLTGKPGYPSPTPPHLVLEGSTLFFNAMQGGLRPKYLIQREFATDPCSKGVKGGSSQETGRFMP